MAEFGKALKKKNSEVEYAKVSEDLGSLEDAADGSAALNAQRGIPKVKKTKSYQAAAPEARDLDPGVLESYEGDDAPAPKKAPQKAPGGPSEVGQVKAYSDYVKDTSPVYKANEAQYQKMLKAHGGHVPSAYAAAKKAGNKGASSHFMQLMKKTAAGKK